MAQTIRCTAVAQVQSLLRGFLQEGSGPFNAVLTGKEMIDLLCQECVETADRIFPPMVTRWACVSQIHRDDPSDRAAVARLNATRVAQGLAPCSPRPGGSWKARQRLPETLLSRVALLRGHRLQHYDALGRLITVTDALGGMTRYEYDSQGYRTAQIDANGNRTTFAYDGRGRLLQVTYPLGQIASWTYDADGRILTFTNGNGEVLRHDNESGGCLAGLLLPDGTREDYTYTLDGLLETVTDTQGTTRYTYDSMRHPSTVTEPDGRYVRYTYDRAGNRVQTAYASRRGAPERVAQYTYDLLNRVTEVTDDQSGVTHYTYDVSGNLTAMTRPNGTSTTYTYDALHRPTLIVHKQADGTILASFQFTLDARGNRTAIIHADHSRIEYTYDAVSRLIAEHHYAPSGTLTGEVTYIYDAVGNLVRRRGMLGDIAYTYNANNQLLLANGMAFTYDEAGRLTATTDGAGVNHYTYDPRGRLVRFESKAGDATTYAYDAFGMRQSSQGPDGTVSFLVDRYNATGVPQVIAATDTMGTTLQTYHYGVSRLARTDNGTVSYYHTDGLGSTRLLTNATGMPTDAYTYTAYGEVLARTGVSTNPFLFAGEHRDSTSGLYYLRARYYDPTTGRFLSRDPLPGNLPVPLTLHPYLYAHANPVNIVDPTGEEGIALNIVRVLQRIKVGVINLKDRTISSTGASLQQAVHYAKILATDALADLELNRYRYVKFFGKYTTQRADRVGTVYFKSLLALAQQIEFYSVADKNAWAEAEQLGPLRIGLGPRFWPEPMIGGSGRRSKAGVLLHELSHIVDGTGDERYHYEPILQLAECCPDKAVRNADNYQFYAEEGW